MSPAGEPSELSARVAPAWRITVAGPGTTVLGTVDEVLRARGWRPVGRPPAGQGLYETGSVLGDVFLGSNGGSILPGPLGRAAKHGYATAEVRVEGETTVLFLALARGVGLADDLREAVDDCLARFRAAGVLIDEGPRMSTGELPTEVLGYPPAFRARLKAIKG